MLKSVDLSSTSSNKKQKRVRAYLFRKQMRYDCVELKQTLTFNEVQFRYARVAWIVSSAATSPKCIALPLLSLNMASEASSPREAMHKLHRNLKFVEIDENSKLVYFDVNDIAQIIQVQFILQKHCKVGVINRFYHSKIIHS